jgi:pathogenesis-related protein 1
MNKPDGSLLWDNCPGEGENIAWGTGLTPAAAMAIWYNENTSMGDYKTEPDNNGNLNGTEVLHFTQMVWYDTKYVGCAQAQCDNQTLHVCRYRPEGNIRGNYFGPPDHNVSPPLCWDSVGPQCPQ